MMAKEWIHCRVVPNEIPVLFARGVEPCMKIPFREGRSCDSDIIGKMRVEGENQLAGIDAALSGGNVEMRHHRKRVHSGVRAT